jgi:hypothetical protein
LERSAVAPSRALNAHVLCDNLESN